MQVVDDAYWAFQAAHSGMNKIELHCSSVKGKLVSALRILFEVSFVT